MSFEGGFGSFKSKASIRRKGAGMSSQDTARYTSMLAEAELREAREEAERINREMNGVEEGEENQDKNGEQNDDSVAETKKKTITG